MPPRHAYWTILIDDKPTAFRAREREELQPTFVQLQRKSPNVTMRWFARGKLWESREAEREDFQLQRHAASAPREPRGDRPAAAERRGSEWRPGGAHKDPRDRFKKKNRPERAWSEKDPATQRDRDKPGYVAKKPWQKPTGDRPWSAKPPSGERRPWQDKPREDSRRPAPSGPGEKRPWTGKPSGPPRERKPWSDKPAPPNDRPWQTKPTGPRAQRKPWVGKPSGDRPWSKPSGDAPRGDRPWRDKPAGEGKRPWTAKPPDRSGPPRERKPWQDKPAGGPPRADRPWSSRPPSGEKRPWTGKPRGDKPGGFNAGGPPRERKPWQGKPAGGPPRGDRPPAGAKRPWSSKPRPGGDGPPRKRRDDED